MKLNARVVLADGRRGRFLSIHREDAYERGVPKPRLWALVELDNGERVTVGFHALEHEQAKQ